MYRINDLREAFSNVAGWQQAYDFEGAGIDSALTVSESGAFFQGVHPLCTLDNLRAVAPQFDKIVLPEWSATEDYEKGARVTFGGSTYLASTASAGEQPGTGDEWAEYDAFSEWLRGFTDTSIQTAIRNIWSSKIQKGTGRNLLESRTLFNGTGRLADTIESTGSLVGFELTPIKSPGVTTKIERVGLQFVGTGAVVMHLMHSSQPVALRSFTLEVLKSNAFTWYKVPELYLPYSQDNDAGGSYYLVYDENELTTLKAINKGKDWSKPVCSTCDRAEYNAYNVWSKYLKVAPLRAPADGGTVPSNGGSFSSAFSSAFSIEMAGEETETVQEGDEGALIMWDVADNIYTDTINYGLNLEISVLCDPTDLMIQHRLSFANVIMLQVVADALRAFAYNAEFRVGRAQQNLKRESILYELDGDSASYKKSGLKYELRQALDAVSLDLRELSKICFPCNNKGIKFRAT